MEPTPGLGLGMGAHPGTGTRVRHGALPGARVRPGARPGVRVTPGTRPGVKERPGAGLGMELQQPKPTGLTRGMFTTCDEETVKTSKNGQKWSKCVESGSVAGLKCV